MESIDPKLPSTELLEPDVAPTILEKGVSAADIQRAHTRVVARLGDTACDGRNTIVTVEEI